MRIRYEITIDDLLAFSLHFHQKSPTLRRTRMWAVIGLACSSRNSKGAGEMLAVNDPFRDRLERRTTSHAGRSRTLVVP